MNTYIITVTYGNRIKYVKSLIEKAFIEDIDKIIIVNNNSDNKSTIELNSLNNPKIKVINLFSNTGSANGYKRGLIEAENDPLCDFIWLIDDDNMPFDNSLIALKKQWEKEDLEDKEKRLCLLSYRRDRKIYKESIDLNRPSFMLGFKNSFHGFHVFNVFNLFAKRVRNNTSSRRLGVVSVAPYSGMFFHKHLLEQIGLPDPKYFLYADDFDFSYRIAKASGYIKLVLDSVLIDNEESWHLSSKKRFNSTLLDCDESRRVYYGLRNCVYFESKYRVDNKIVYHVNMLIYLFLLKCFSGLYGGSERYDLLINATRDGLKQKLGINKKYR